MNETHAILHRLRELAVQAATDTNTLEDRKAIQREVNELIDAIDEIANNTEFNATKILDGSFSGKIHIGANQDQNMDISITSMKSADLGIAGGQTLADLKVDNLDDDTTETGGVLTYDDANSAIGVIDGAIKQVSNERAMLGAIQNRLEHSIANLNSSAENLRLLNHGSGIRYGRRVHGICQKHDSPTSSYLNAGPRQYGTSECCSCSDSRIAINKIYRKRVLKQGYVFALVPQGLT